MSESAVVVADTRARHIANPNHVKPTAHACKHCKLSTYSKTRVCAMCELYGPVRSKKMQKAFEAKENK